VCVSLYVRTPAYDLLQLTLKSNFLLPSTTSDTLQAPFKSLAGDKPRLQCTDNLREVFGRQSANAFQSAAQCERL